MALAWSLCSSCVVVWVEYIITSLNLWEGGTGRKNVPHICNSRTTQININQININPNDYYNVVMDYYNPVIDYYNLLLRFEPCLNLLGLILILCKININLININPT